MRALRFLFLISLSSVSAQTSDNWTTYGKNYSGWRYSELSEINSSSVKRLAPQWVFQTGVPGNMETTPLVSGGLMFLTAPSNHAFALDLLTGKPYWRYSKTPPKPLDLCCGEVNRGFAKIRNRLFKVNIEDRLVALDARSGAVLWEVELGDYRKGYSGTVAPLALAEKNLVIVGTAGAEFGIRGFIDAYQITGRCGRLRTGLILASTVSGTLRWRRFEARGIWPRKSNSTGFSFQQKVFPGSHPGAAVV